MNEFVNLFVEEINQNGFLLFFGAIVGLSNCSIIFLLSLKSILFIRSSFKFYICFSSICLNNSSLLDLNLKILIFSFSDSSFIFCSNVYWSLSYSSNCFFLSESKITFLASIYWICWSLVNLFISAFFFIFWSKNLAFSYVLLSASAAIFLSSSASPTAHTSPNFFSINYALLSAFSLLV